MEYQEDFKQRVSKALENNPNVNRLLDSNSEMVGRYLEDSSQGRISPEEIVEAIESKNLEPLYNKAKNLMEIKALYDEWQNTYDNPSNKMHM